MNKMEQSYQSAQVYTSNQGLSALKLKARAQSPEAIEGVAKQFEALFLQMMLKSMRGTSGGEGLFDSEQGKMYMDLFDKQIALEMSKNGSFGMAQLIRRQLTQMTTGDTKTKSLIDLSGNKSDSNLLISSGRALLALQVPTAVKIKITQQLNKLQQTEKSVTTDKSSEQATALTSNRIDSEHKQYASPLEYAKAVWSDIKSTAKELGVSPVAMLAQSILETGWGKHIASNQNGSSSHNLFGIKAGSIWGGQQTSAKTTEYIQGKKINLMQEFRSYSSARQSVGDYANLLKSNPRFSSVLEKGSSVEGFAQAMQQSGYATDPEYGAKIINIVNGPTFHKIMQQVK